MKLKNLKIILNHSSTYKPYSFKQLKKKNNNKQIFLKNYIYFFLFLNYFKKILNLINFSFIFLKKKKYLKNVLRSPNRHKKAQTKLVFNIYKSALTIYLNYNYLINNNFIYFFILSVFFFKFFNFFESALLSLNKKTIFYKFFFEL